MSAGRRWAAAAAAILPCAVLAQSAPSPVTQLAGRYSQSFANALVDGTAYTSENIVEIVTVDPRHSYIRMELNFFNGHVCSLRGVARAEGRALVYREPGLPLGTQQCVLTVQRHGARLSWDDGAGTCQSFCGARGGLGDGELPWKSKRPITDLKRLKAASEYRDAVTEWRTGKKVNP